MTTYLTLQRLLQRRKIWQTILFSLLIFILFLATSPDPYPVPASDSDKVNHVLAFACLGVLACWSYPASRSTLLAGLLLAYGLGIELVQALLPHRDFSLLDLVADALGIGLGLILGIAMHPNRGFRRSR